MPSLWFGFQEHPGSVLLLWMYMKLLKCILVYVFQIYQTVQRKLDSEVESD